MKTTLAWIAILVFALLLVAKCIGIVVLAVKGIDGKGLFVVRQIGYVISLTVAIVALLGFIKKQNRW